VADYIRTVKALLRGEETSWDGQLIKMMAWPGYLPDRPIEVPWVVAAMGPKGEATARQEADGVFVVDNAVAGIDWNILLAFGTVLRPGEDPNSARVLNAAGPGAAVLYHFSVAHNNPDLVPGAKEYAALYDDVAPERLHLELHYGHLCGLNERDRTFITGDMLAGAGLALSREGWREKIAALEASGVTELVYQPIGDHIPAELEDFAAMFQGS
jgi:5,10-methylenetetrahydromethanopterin reductase